MHVIVRSPKLWLKSEDALPVVLHADDDPALVLGLFVQLLRKDDDFPASLPLRSNFGSLVRNGLPSLS
jgi:hypothetical protein